MAQNRVVYLCALAGAVAFYVFYTAWISFFVLVLALVLPVFSLLCSLPGMLKAHLEAYLPERADMGTVPRLIIRVGSGRGLTAPLCRFALLKTDMMSGEKTVQRLRMCTAAELAVPTEHCGAVRFSFQKGRAYDRLGLFSVKLKLPSDMETAVWPLKREISPAPDMTELLPRAFTPAPGCFAEEHDMREYRPGDTAREICWKLTAKTDKVIVREALKPVRPKALISLELPLPREKTDKALGEVSWLSALLLEKGIPHSLCCFRKNEPPLTFEVENDHDFRSAMDSILRCRAGSGGVKAGGGFDDGWHYHIGREGEI